MALCKCLYYADSTLHNNEGSTGYFFNRTSYDPVVYDILDSLILLKKPKFRSLTGNKLGIAGCITLYESDTLKLEIEKMDRYLGAE